MASTRIVSFTLLLVSLAVLRVTTLGAQQPAAAKSCLHQSFPASVRTDRDRVAWIIDLKALPQSRGDATGNSVRLSLHDVVVEAVTDSGFWIVAPDSQCRLFVVPAEGRLIRVHSGEVVAVQGELRVTDAASSGKVGSGVRRYLYSYTVRPAW